MILDAARASEALDAEAYRAIEGYLERRGLKLESIQRRVWDWRLFFRRELSNVGRAYRVKYVSQNGEATVHIFGFEPTNLSTLGNRGLKRWANGVWFDAS